MKSDRCLEWQPAVLSRTWAAWFIELAKLALLVVLAGVAAAFSSGLLEEHRQLSADGVHVSAHVIGKRFNPASSTAAHVLTLAYKTQSGEAAETEHTVSFEQYRSVEIGSSLDVTYARNNPSLLQIGTYRFDAGAFVVSVGLLAICIASMLVQLMRLLPAAWWMHPESMAFRLSSALTGLTNAAIMGAIIIIATLLLSVEAERDRLLGAADARTTEATVIETWAEPGLFQPVHWVAYRFSDENGADHFARSVVAAAQVALMAPTSKLQITYAPAQPSTTEVGTHRSALWTLVAIMIAIAVCSILLIVQLWHVYRSLMPKTRQLQGTGREPFLEFPGDEAHPLPRFLKPNRRRWASGGDDWIFGHHR